ncbi:MAG: DUF2279 domain-containing protein [Bacteroidales bacterium]
MKWLTAVLILLTNSNLSHFAYSQNDSIKKERQIALLIGTASVWAASTTCLYYQWYADYPTSKFHSFNDNAEWLQMDKAGHFVTAGITTTMGYSAFRWAGYSEKKALLLGGGLSVLFLSSIEIMDGFNKQWGFSWGDMLANTTGSIFPIVQQLYWNEQRISFKASYHSSSLAVYRPDLLGKQWYEQIIKDYNGQTYWISVNPSSFVKNRSILPGWLNVAFGYGATGMLGGRVNPPSYHNNPLPELSRYRKFFIGPDISLTRLPIKNKTLKAICKTLDFIKLPMPSLEYNKTDGFIFHFMYF